MKAVLVVVALLALGGVARADGVDELVNVLTTGSEAKDRLSAAASLARAGDQRAIAAFIAVLVGDSKDDAKSVRGAAAAGLAKVVTSATSLEDRNRALAALVRARKDEDSFVRKQAKAALLALKKLDAGASVVGSGTGTSTAVSVPEADAPTWSPDGWTLLGEDDVDLVDDEFDVDRRKSTWSEVAIVVTGDEVQLDTVELGLAGKGRKRHHADIGQTFSADSHPRIIELTGKRRTIDKVRLTYTKHTLGAQSRVQVWAR